LINRQPFMILVGIWTLASFPSVAAEDGYQRCQYYRGISASYTITQTVEGDLDGDGANEVVVGYREADEAVNQAGGLLILSGSGEEFIVAWHGFFEKTYPKKITVSGGTVSIEFVQKSTQGEKSFSRGFVCGKDFFFRKTPGSSFAGVKVTASSTLKRDGIKPGNAFDQDVRTSWAEGAEGTGVDESLKFEFSKPVDIGLIGVLHGNYKSAKDWKENNRIHRAEVTMETASDRYDTESDVDFESDLGLGLYGDKLEMTFSDKPVMKYFRVEKRSVLGLDLKITSTLLGEKNDDAHIAEIDFAEWVSLAKITGEQKSDDAAAHSGKKEEKEPKPSKKKSEEKSSDWTDEEP
jgi:hypothetical protein